MDAIKYLKEQERMCETHQVNCDECPFIESYDGEDVKCDEFPFTHPRRAVELVEKWSAENPPKTILQGFLEKYPNVQLNGYGCPSFCPSLLGYDRNKSCLPDEMRCPACWNRPLEG